MARTQLTGGLTYCPQAGRQAHIVTFMQSSIIYQYKSQKRHF